MSYSSTMEFEWDEAKSDACFAERGFDFAYVVRAFLDSNRAVRPDFRRSYGEDRYQLFGSIEGRVFCVVYTPTWPHHSHHFRAQGQSARGSRL